MKIKKIIASLSAAVIMMASVSVMGASAEVVNIPAGSYTMRCTSKQQDGKIWALTTSINKANTSVSAIGSGYYYINGAKKTESTANGNGSIYSGIDCFLYNTKGHGWEKCISNHSSTVAYNYWTVKGHYVA